MRGLLPSESLARCQGCQYPLRGLTEARCPECGRPFDPADPTTMWHDRVPGRVGRFFLKPPGWPLNTATILVGLMMLVAASGPGTYFGLFALALLAWLVIVTAWFVRFLVSLALIRYYRRPFREQLARWRRWGLAPAVAAATAGLLAFDVPLHVTLGLSRSAMDRLAQHVMSLPPDAPATPDQWVGLYYATRIERCPGGMRFTIPGSGLFAPCGFVYSPSGPASKTRDFFCPVLSGPWYVSH
jgi:hypothetical protein